MRDLTHEEIYVPLVLHRDLRVEDLAASSPAQSCDESENLEKSEVEYTMDICQGNPESLLKN